VGEKGKRRITTTFKAESYRNGRSAVITMVSTWIGVAWISLYPGKRPHYHRAIRGGGAVTQKNYESVDGSCWRGVRGGRKLDREHYQSSRQNKRPEPPSIFEEEKGVAYGKDFLGCSLTVSVTNSALIYTLAGGGTV